MQWKLREPYFVRPGRHVITYKETTLEIDVDANGHFVLSRAANIPLAIFAKPLPSAQS